MGYCVAGGGAATPLSIVGPVFQMVSHGLISALLFLLVGVVYHTTGTRDLQVAERVAESRRGLPFVGSLMTPGGDGPVPEFPVCVGLPLTFWCFGAVS